MLLPHCTTLYAPHERMIAYMYILHTFHSILTFIVHVIHVSVLREFDGLGIHREQHQPYLSNTVEAGSESYRAGENMCALGLK